MPVGFHWDDDGLGLGEGSSSDHVFVGCAGAESGVGMTVGMVTGGPPGAASRVGSGPSSLRLVALGVRVEGLGTSACPAVALTSSDSSSTWTGWVGYTKVNAGSWGGAATAEFVPVGVGPPISAAAGIETATRVPLA